MTPRKHLCQDASLVLFYALATLSLFEPALAQPAGNSSLPPIPELPFGDNVLFASVAHGTETYMFLALSIATVFLAALSFCTDRLLRRGQAYRRDNPRTPSSLASRLSFPARISRILSHSSFSASSSHKHHDNLPPPPTRAVILVLLFRALFAAAALLSLWPAVSISRAALEPRGGALPALAADAADPTGADSWLRVVVTRAIGIASADSFDPVRNSLGVGPILSGAASASLAERKRRLAQMRARADDAAGEPGVVTELSVSVPTLARESLARAEPRALWGVLLWTVVVTAAVGAGLVLCAERVKSQRAVFAVALAQAVVWVTAAITAAYMGGGDGGLQFHASPLVNQWLRRGGAEGGGYIEHFSTREAPPELNETRLLGNWFVLTASGPNGAARPVALSEFDGFENVFCGLFNELLEEGVNAGEVVDANAAGQNSSNVIGSGVLFANVSMETIVEIVNTTTLNVTEDMGNTTADTDATLPEAIPVSINTTTIPASAFGDARRIDRFLASKVLLTYLMGKPLGGDLYRGLAYLSLAALTLSPALVGQAFAAWYTVPLGFMWFVVVFTLGLIFTASTLRPGAVAARRGPQLVRFCERAYVVVVTDGRSQMIWDADRVAIALVVVAAVIRAFSWIWLADGWGAEPGVERVHGIARLVRGSDARGVVEDDTDEEDCLSLPSDIRLSKVSELEELPGVYRSPPQSK